MTQNTSTPNSAGPSQPSSTNNLSLSNFWATRPPRMSSQNSRSNWLFGVCEGIAIRYQISVAFVRLCFVLLAFVLGSGFFLYTLAILIFPRYSMEKTPLDAFMDVDKDPKYKRERSIALWDGILTVLVGVGVIGSVAGIIGILLGIGGIYALYRRLPYPPAGLLAGYTGPVSEPVNMTQYYVSPGFEGFRDQQAKAFLGLEHTPEQDRDRALAADSGLMDTLLENEVQEETSSDTLKPYPVMQDASTNEAIEQFEYRPQMAREKPSGFTFGKFMRWLFFAALAILLGAILWLIGAVGLGLFDVITDRDDTDPSQNTEVVASAETDPMNGNSVTILRPQVIDHDQDLEYPDASGRVQILNLGDLESVDIDSGYIYLTGAYAKTLIYVPENYSGPIFHLLATCPSDDDTNSSPLCFSSQNIGTVEDDDSPTIRLDVQSSDNVQFTRDADVYHRALQGN